MFDNIFTSLTPEDKIKNYQLYNDPANMFNMDISLDSFAAPDKDELESKINKQQEDKQKKFLEESTRKNEELLAKLSNKPKYIPMVTPENPFPYLSKPVIDLAKYDTDKVAQPIIKKIDDSSYDAADKTYLKLLGARESDFRQTAGKGSYRGIYQFNKDALAAVGIKMEDYLSDPHKQFEAALRYRDSNLNELKDYQKYIGTVKDGVLVTKNGIGAMAHLLGPNTVRDYFDGTKKTKLAQNGFKDGNGTPIQEYLKMFA